jgi:hypothetical protein
MTSTTDDDKDKDKKPDKPRGKRRPAAQAAQLFTTPPTPKDVVFMARELILCTLPHSDPGDVPAWSRKNGHLTLGIQPGFDYKTGKSYGIPYGIIPRLLLVWIVTEIIRTKNRRLELGAHLSDFLLKIGLNASNGTGKRSDARRVREQMERLFNAIISFDYSETFGGWKCQSWIKIQIAPKGGLWWSENIPDKGALWGSWIEVSEEFYKAVMEAPSPLDIRVLRHIKDSSLGIDLYTILNREAYRAMMDGRPRFLAWEWLLAQTGNEYTGTDGLKNFRRKALEQIEALVAVHPGLVVAIQRGRRGQKAGVLVSNLSRPSIPPEEPPRPVTPPEGAAPRPAPALAGLPPLPPRERRLLPETVEVFRVLFRGLLDPLACKADFDAWQEGLPPHRRARHYDKAFLGFAESWAEGRI